MKKALLLTAVLLALPAVSLAATYSYVNGNGQMQSVEAANADAALALAVNIAPNSGVMLAPNQTTTTQTTGAVTQTSTTMVSGNTVTTVALPSGSYQYVDVSGNVKFVVAASPDAALALATDIAPHSGVMSVAATGAAIPLSTDVSL